MNFVVAALIALTGNSLIYASIAFINAEFFATALKSLYAQTTPLMRLLMITVSTIPLANYLFSSIYKLIDPANAGMIVIVALVFVLVTKSILLGVGSVTPRMAVAFVFLVAAAMWVSYELHHSI